MNAKKRGKIIIPSGASPWPHELRVAKILCDAGYTVEFIQEKINVKSPDVKLNGTPFEIKSPKSSKANSLEHILKNGLKQCDNLIIDASRIRGMNNNSIKKFLISQKRIRKQIKRLILIDKNNAIIDINDFL